MISLHLFDKDENPITLTDNLRFQNENFEKYPSVKLVRQNKIASEQVFRTKKIGTDQVKIPTLHRLQSIETS